MPDTNSSTVQTHIQFTNSRLTLADRWDHVLVRCGVNRGGHRVESGLYALGNPTPDSPVFVTSNYTLSFDALRSALDGIDSYILVLDTHGVNVWCAAGKGTFGTHELVHRIEATHLHDVVRHRVLVLPQLGAPGVAAHEVRKRSKFKVEYGPVRAADLPDYLRTHEATPDMRQVRFTLRDRAILIPVELRIPLLLVLVASVLYLLGVKSPSWRDAGWLAAFLGGMVLFPLLLPWIPTRDFSSKGFILGGLVALPFTVLMFRENPSAAWWWHVSVALTSLMIWSSVTAFLSLGFTGATTFTSRTGVRREIFTYFPAMAWLFGIGVVLQIILALI